MSRQLMPPVLAIPCSLDGVSMWSSHDVRMFSELVSDQEVEVYFTSDQNADGHYLVQLMNRTEHINPKFWQPTGTQATGY